MRLVRPLGRNVEEARWRFDLILQELELGDGVRRENGFVRLRDAPPLWAGALSDDGLLVAPPPPQSRAYRGAQKEGRDAPKKARRGRRTAEQLPAVPQPPETTAPALPAASWADGDAVTAGVVGIGFETAARLANAFLRRQGYEFGPHSNNVSLIHSESTPDGGYRLIYAYWAGVERPFAVEVSPSGEIRGIAAMTRTRSRR